MKDISSLENTENNDCKDEYNSKPRSAWSESDYIDQFKPSNSQIENYYNKNKKLFLQPEKRDFLQFNFKSLDEASEFKNQTLEELS